MFGDLFSFFISSRSYALVVFRFLTRRKFGHFGCLVMPPPSLPLPPSSQVRLGRGCIPGPPGALGTGFISSVLAALFLEGGIVLPWSLYVFGYGGVDPTCFFFLLVRYLRERQGGAR